MKKIALIKFVKIRAAIQTVSLIPLVFMLLPLPKEVIKWITVAMGSVYVAISVTELCFSVFGVMETPDERDQRLLNKAADRSIAFNGLILVLLTFLFFGSSILAVQGVALGLIGAKLPSVLRDHFFLYFEKNDWGEY